MIFQTLILLDKKNKFEISLHHQVAKLLGLENSILWQRLNSFGNYFILRWTNQTFRNSGNSYSLSMGHEIGKWKMEESNLSHFVQFIFCKYVRAVRSDFLLKFYLKLSVIFQVILPV